MFKRLVAITLCSALAGPVLAQDGLSEGDMATGFYLPLAQGGEPYAQLAMGDIYAEGLGIDRDLVAAYAWYFVASSQGVDEAFEPMGKVWQELSEEQKPKAKALAEEFARVFVMPE